jgi:hypothetical protein
MIARLQEWINYFDKLWQSKLEKLKTLLDNKHKN